MRISYASIPLAHGNPAFGMVGPAGLALNGRQVVDEVEFFNAVTASFFERGARSVDFSFSVARIFDSPGEAQAWTLLHYGDLPDAGTLRVTCDGLGGADGPTVVLPAVFDGPQFQDLRGSTVTVRYAFRGPAWSSDESPVPDPDPAMTRRANIAIADGATSVAVVFGTPMSGAPFVTCTVLMPTAGGDVVIATIVEDTITAEGFTAALSGPVSGDGYKLSYFATL